MYETVNKILKLAVETKRRVKMWQFQQLLERLTRMNLSGKEDK